MGKWQLRCLSAMGMLLLLYAMVMYTSMILMPVLLSILFGMLIIEWLLMIQCRNRWVNAVTVVCCVLTSYLGLQSHLNDAIMLSISKIWFAVIGLMIFTIGLYNRYGRLFIRSSLFYSMMAIPLAWASLATIHWALLSGHRRTLWWYLLWVCGVDIYGYIFGKAFGNRPLMVSVSPGKTCIGAMAAVLLTPLVGYGALSYTQGYLASWSVLSFGLLMAAFAIIGDLFESVIKRLHGVKDSGSLIPGHGGLWDRVDGVIAVLPFFPLWVQWVL